MRSRPFLVSLTVLVTIGVAYPALAGPSADERGERVRNLRQQVEQNDVQIRVLEETVRRIQAGKGGIDAGKHSPATDSRLGDISAWSTGGPATTATAPVAPEPPARPVVAAPVVPRDTRPVRSPSAALHGSVRPRSLLAAAPLKMGMSQVRVWETLGPPEFVRGRRTEVQYWHYGPGWIRFQAGRITRWEVGSNQLRADRE